MRRWARGRVSLAESGCDAKALTEVLYCRQGFVFPPDSSGVVAGPRKPNARAKDAELQHAQKIYIQLLQLWDSR